MAIIFDIRRGNMIEHLMYKALFELSADRADFLSKLFSRPRPAGLDTASTAGAAVRRRTIRVSPDSALYRKNLAAITRQADEGPRLRAGRQRQQVRSSTSTRRSSAADRRSTTTIPAATGRWRLRTRQHADVRVAAGGDGSAGRNWAYLATEANYRWLKDFESKNLLVPVVGDFAGPKAIRAVGKYLKDHHAIVGAFYTSNVEQYLFQGADEWKRYYANVATLPLDSTSSFIRSIGGGFAAAARPLRVAAQQMLLGGRLPSVTCSIQDLLKAFNDGKIVGYGDVIDMSR